MRKYLTTGLFSAILGIVIGGAPADAALVSRGFLDEALENYATTTALDLKANQSDFTDLSSKIGELPSGNFPGFPESKNLFSKLRQPLTYPTSLAELITAIYGNSETGGPGLLAAIITGFPTDPDGDGSPDKIVGLIPNFWLARDANNLANANATKIGTLPEGEIAPSPGFDNFLSMYSSITNTPISYPTSVAEFVELLLGNSSNPGLLGLMSSGVRSIDSNSGAPIGIHANYLRINDMSEKIGTLPDGYETVGAALTAIKGIAEDAKAAALSAIPDPKAEGSTGKFVLTVDIVGDNATYRWEKIDREGETTTTE